MAVGAKGSAAGALPSSGTGCRVKDAGVTTWLLISRSDPGTALV